MLDTISPELRDVAAEARQWFEYVARENGPDYHRVRDGAPEWVKDLAREAHGRDRDGAPAMLPDDHRYAFAVQALDAILDGTPGDDLAEIRDAATEPDVYTGELIEWLGSHGHRLGYVDDAASEYGPAESESQRIALGQMMERGEVFDLVAGFLAERLDDD